MGAGTVLAPRLHVSPGIVWMNGYEWNIHRAAVDCLAVRAVSLLRAPFRRESRFLVVRARWALGVPFLFPSMISIAIFDRIDHDHSVSRANIQSHVVVWNRHVIVDLVRQRARHTSERSPPRRALTV